MGTEFYALTPREFVNIQMGFYRRKEDELKQQLLLNRGLKFAMVMPYLKDKNATEEKLFPLYFEAPIANDVDLKKEIEEVEKQKIDFWQKIDAMKTGKA